jgi:hypothetical protein
MKNKSYYRVGAEFLSYDKKKRPIIKRVLCIIFKEKKNIYQWSLIGIIPQRCPMTVNLIFEWYPQCNVCVLKSYSHI